MANQKGGVAKTTSTYNLAYVKAEEGHSVLMIDLDPQASLTILCGMQPGQTDKSVCDLFDPKTEPLDCGFEVPNAGQDNFYIIPSDIELAVTEQNLIGRMAREKILMRQLDRFGSYFDYVFLDCPPQLGVLTMNALVAATDVIIPSKAEYLSYRGVRSLQNTLQATREEFNPDLKLDGFIITFYEKAIAAQRQFLEQYEKDGNVLGVVKKSADAYRTDIQGVPAVMSQRSSDIAKSYRAIAEKI